MSAENVNTLDEIKDEDLLKEVEKAAIAPNQFTTDIKDVIREYFKQQFTAGLGVGSKTIITVVYRMLLSETPIEDLEKEELVELINGVKKFCERALEGEDLVKVQEEAQED